MEPSIIADEGYGLEREKGTVAQLSGSDRMNSFGAKPKIAGIVRSKRPRKRRWLGTPSLEDPGFDITPGISS